jgi:DNA-binding transcriptional LysR family regulator
MAGLEKAVGIRLLDRDDRGVRLTDAGVASLVNRATVRDRRADLVALLTTTPIPARVVVRTGG